MFFQAPGLAQRLSGRTPTKLREVRTFLLALALGSLALACSSDDGHPAALGSRALPECPGLDPSPCDTRASACQARLLELAACVYGVEQAPDVPIRVVSEQQLLDELRQEPSGDAGSDPMEAERTQHVENALVALSLLSPGDLTSGGGVTEQIVDQVDGVYQDAERGIALVDRGRPQDTPEAAAVLVHEFVHAIQDERYDLNLWRQQQATDVDSSLSLRSVSEGQATYAQFRVLYAMMGYDLASVDLASALDAFRDRVLRTVYEDASPYVASFTTFPYAIGVHAAERSWSATGLHYAERQFQDPPLTTLQALGDSYGLDLARPTARVPPAPEIEAGFELVDQTRLGAFMFELFLRRHGLGAADARALALDWTTDRLWIYAGPNDSSAFLWEVELQASRFDILHEQLEAPPAGGIREQRGQRLFVVGGDASPAFLVAAGRAFLEEAG